MRSRLSHTPLNTSRVQPCATNVSGDFIYFNRKRVRTLDSFFVSNQTHTESTERDEAVEQSINEEGTEELERKQAKKRSFQTLGCEITRGCALKRRRCSATPGARDFSCAVSGFSIASAEK